MCTSQRLRKISLQVLARLLIMRFELDVSELAVEPEIERFVKSIVTFAASGGKEFVVEVVGNDGVVELFL
ncbi:hypothetical protein QTG54_013235 [Skeletonema marinoi]|uniref:Uncharacterized protein n=1 Tax=Skeletonema marinoi TaxID=267567 RepID=A0AAD8XYR5_9STRA|nr:hypothetical protein QTG54_013235 [Skeletonema marinoi]